QIKNAEIKKFNFVPIPHNEKYELDLHKPYIDEIELVCDCGGNLKREKEVMDVWLDSGTMPFSQDHYPFDFAQGKPFENKELSYPADFICEAIDQTRGWFYTLHAVGVIMGKGKAYKNVICLGHLLDANGKKMSKSLGNIVDPWIMMDKYGADTLRLWMYSVNQPGESKNFDEKTVSELHSKVFNLLYNVLAFYELYRDNSLETITYKLEPNSNVLDKWIITRLNELTENITKQLDDYKLLEPVRAIREFIDDLSTWYLRRSRERIKEESANPEVKQAHYGARKTLYYVLKTLIKLMAPFTPFTSEDIWQKLKNENDEESVHLADWPISKNRFKIFNLFKKKNKILEEMKKVRDIVTLGLQARQKAEIPVRQPLQELIITNYELQIEYEEIIKDELNVKSLKYIKGEEKKVELDTNITEELKQEGNYRELVRAIQDIRKKNGLNPNDIVTLQISASTEGQELINKFKKELMKAVSAKEIQIKENNGIKVKIDKLLFKIIIEK
ncbi:MAG: class I tRNA ligase family protein, partial [Candidatus Paceibacterota bacterium]